MTKTAWVELRSELGVSPWPAAANTSLRREHGTAVTRAEELEDERDALMQEITEVCLGGSCLPRHI